METTPDDVDAKMHLELGSLQAQVKEGTQDVVNARSEELTETLETARTEEAKAEAILNEMREKAGLPDYAEDLAKPNPANAIAIAEVEGVESDAFMQNLEEETEEQFGGGMLSGLKYATSGLWN